MSIVITVICFLAVVMMLALPFIIIDEFKKACNKDKNYKLFRIKAKQAELQQQLNTLRKEITDYEEDFVTKKNTRNVIGGNANEKNKT